MKFILILLFIISLGSGANYFHQNFQPPPSYQGNSEPFNFPKDNTLRLVGIMSQFPLEFPDNPQTSGDGQFLSGGSEEYINFLESETPRCTGFLVDKPPHNLSYLQKQLEAVGNYYINVSDSNLLYTADIISNSNFSGNDYYTVSHEMEYYAKSDTLLARFFSEVLDSAKSDVEDYFSTKIFTPDDVIFIVFHAGLSQDFSYPSLDPTIYDLKSAYIDTIMMKDIVPTRILQYEIIYDVKTGLLLPETQNIIYYHVVEDIFGNPDYGTESLCYTQIGLTGIFAFLLGYELGLPPMFNNDATSIYYGEPGVGLFGLMDQGSNNGMGVIPAVPTPWTRIKAGWDVTSVISSNHIDTISIEAYNLSNEIFKIDISDSEYFIIENRNNWVLNKVDIDSLRRAQKHDDNQLGYWFDVVTDSLGEFVQNDLIEIDELTEVIIGFDHYDYGLPGSGILIWHIKEPDKGIYSLGINNDRYNRHVQIEEADGAMDIGFESYAFFASDNPTAGTRWDMWYNGNEAYEFANPERYTVTFNNWSNPNSRTIDGAESFLSLRILTEIAETMEIKVNSNISIVDEEVINIVNLSDEPVHYLGNSFSLDEMNGFIYYSLESSIFQYNSTGSILLSENNYIIEDLNQTDSLIFSNNDEIILTSNSSSCINIAGEYQLECSIPEGYIKNDELISVEEANLSFLPSDLPLSLGDIDFDGLDEIIYVKDDSLFAYNFNNVKVNGFPIKGNFSGIPLIANILSIEDNKPEIICRENNDIVIISNVGERLRHLSSFDRYQPLAMVPFWDGKMALIDGSRVLLFDLDMDYSYWLNPRSRPSGFPRPLSTSIHSSLSNQNISQQKAYNYPNPVTTGRTTFRFFVGSTVGNIQVRIYDAAGFLVKDGLELISDNVTENEFNEIIWDNIQVNSGLYLAEIKRDIGVSELVRLVVIK